MDIYPTTRDETRQFARQHGWGLGAAQITDNFTRGQQTIAFSYQRGYHDADYESFVAASLHDPGSNAVTYQRSVALSWLRIER